MQLLCTGWGSGGGDRDDGREVEGPRAFSIHRTHTQTNLDKPEKSRSPAKCKTETLRNSQGNKSF